MMDHSGTAEEQKLDLSVNSLINSHALSSQLPQIDHHRSSIIHTPTHTCANANNAGVVSPSHPLQSCTVDFLSSYLTLVP